MNEGGPCQSEASQIDMNQNQELLVQNPFQTKILCPWWHIELNLTFYAQNKVH